MNERVRKLMEGIRKNDSIGAIQSCASVSVEIGQYFYGKPQNDKKSAVIEATYSSEVARKISDLLVFTGTREQIAVWHFLVEETPKSPSQKGSIHHFVVIPWCQTSGERWTVYAVLMAYEEKYTLQGYLEKKNIYKQIWSQKDLGTMLRRLITDQAAWQEYFDVTSYGTTPRKITCWKYNNI